MFNPEEWDDAYEAWAEDELEAEYEQWLDDQGLTEEELDEEAEYFDVPMPYLRPGMIANPKYF